MSISIGASSAPATAATASDIGVAVAKKALKQQTIEGELVQFIFRNPHSFVHIEGKDEKGEMVQYAIEWGGGGALGQQGVTRETLKPGDHLIVVGNPGRNPEDHRLRMIRLKRTTDGWTWGGKPGEKFE